MLKTSINLQNWDILRVIRCDSFRLPEAENIDDKKNGYARVTWRISSKPCWLDHPTFLLKWKEEKQISSLTRINFLMNTSFQWKLGDLALLPSRMNLELCFPDKPNKKILVNHVNEPCIEGKSLLLHKITTNKTHLWCGVWILVYLHLTQSQAFQKFYMKQYLMV